MKEIWRSYVHQQKTYDKLIVRVVGKDESESDRLTSARSERHAAERHGNIGTGVLNLRNKTLKMKWNDTFGNFKVLQSSPS